MEFDIDPDDLLQQTILRLRYQETVQTDLGQIPQACIEEVSIDGPAGRGSDASQSSVLFPHGCGHVGVKAASICRHGLTCCEKCSCQTCGWGICSGECRARQPGEIRECAICHAHRVRAAQRARIEASFGVFLQFIGVAE